MRGTASAALVLGLVLASAGARAADERQILVAAGPATIAKGPVGVGSALVTLPVRHAVTGRLTNRIKMDSFFGRDAPLEVGQPVFAISAQTGAPVWCAPRIKPGRIRYETACLTPQPIGLYDWEIGRTPAMAPAAVGHASDFASGRADAAPKVDPGPVPLPAMTLSLVLGDIRPDPQGRPDARLYDLEVKLDWGEGPRSFDHRPVVMTGDGGVAEVMGMTVRLEPGSDPKQVKVLGLEASSSP